MTDSGEVNAVDAFFHDIFKRIALIRNLPGQGVDTFVLSNGEVLKLSGQYLTSDGEARCLGLCNILSDDADRAGCSTIVDGIAICFTRVTSVDRAGCAQGHIGVNDPAAAATARAVGSTAAC